MLFKRPLVLSIVAAVFKDRADLVAENIAVVRENPVQAEIVEVFGMSRMSR